MRPPVATRDAIAGIRHAIVDVDPGPGVGGDGHEGQVGPGRAHHHDGSARGIDPDRGLLAIGDLVEPGREIQFARRDPNTARADLERMVEGLKARLDVPARGALYFSCLGRGRHQFGDDSAEMRLLQSLLGDVPLAGFYANGEISHNRLYGYTGVLTLFS